MNRLHDNNGMLLVGIDRHFGQHFPTPIPFFTFFWELTLMHPFWMGGNQKPTVQINGGHNTVVDQHTSNLLWPHFPIAPDPLNMWVPIDIVFGNHKTWLARSTVHIVGTPAAITLFPAPLSINMDCWTGSNIPPSLIAQPGTVVTTASLGDYFRAGVRLAINIVMEIIACRGAIAKTPSGKVTPSRFKLPTRRQFMSMFRRPALSTFRNSLGRQFATRLLPMNINRSSGRPRLEWGSPQQVFDWARGKLGYSNQALGTAAQTGQLPTPSVQSVLKATVPPYNSVEGIQQSDGQRDFNPFG